MSTKYEEKMMYEYLFFLDDDMNKIPIVPIKKEVLQKELRKSIADTIALRNAIKEGYPYKD